MLTTGSARSSPRGGEQERERGDAQRERAWGPSPGISDSRSLRGSRPRAGTEEAVRRTQHENSSRTDPRWNGVRTRGEGPQALSSPAPSFRSREIEPLSLDAPGRKRQSARTQAGSAGRTAREAQGSIFIIIIIIIIIVRSLRNQREPEEPEGARGSQEPESS